MDFKVKCGKFIIVINLLIIKNMGVEDRYIEDIDSGSGLSNNPEFLKIQISWNKAKPGLKQFKRNTGDYTWDKIAADINKVEAARRHHDKKGQNAIAGEVVIMELINAYELLAKDILVFPVTDYDDFFNGTDFVLRFNKKNEDYAYLAVDVKTSNNEALINEYRQRNLNALRHNELGQLKYFEDPETDILGSYSLPKVVVALDPEYAVKMQGILVKIKNKEKLTETEEETIKEANKSIEDRIIAQVEAIIVYLYAQEARNRRLHPEEKESDKSKEFLQKYKEILALIKNKST